jgi:hypothetical protein
MTESVRPIRKRLSQRIPVIDGLNGASGRNCVRGLLDEVWAVEMRRRDVQARAMLEKCRMEMGNAARADKEGGRVGAAV